MAEFNYPLASTSDLWKRLKISAQRVLSSASSLDPTRWELNNDTRFDYLLAHPSDLMVFNVENDVT